MRTQRKQQTDLLLIAELPERITDTDVLSYLHSKDINWKHIKTIKKLTDFNDDVISNWLNVSTRTFRSYRLPNSKFKENIKEQILLLLSLIRHGIEVLGSTKDFDNWLNTPNYFFDNRTPISFLNTVTGIRFVDDRISAIEYGDNV
ncbi:MAG: hypothetical protein A2491_17890 [Bacteroidetes bacterium RIFOXYC12_FULL_35_7]|nr:MAG: hypothetical protein A2491_17890 [Bacteroidetes bacterium RIFOXYC12_FULL_35_7]